MNVLMLGASKGMGRALARGFAERGDRLALLGRDLEDLARSAQDLAARSLAVPAPTLAVCDLAHPDGFAAALDTCFAALGRVDVVVVSAALFATQEELEADLPRLRTLLEVNFVNTILFCEAVRVRLLAQGGGTLCVFSSVAGERARKPVVLYGASKAGLSAYLEGLDHKFSSQGLRVVTVKPGFVRTGMTAGLKPPPFAGEPDAVARRVLRAIDRGTPVVYAPAVWGFILFVIRHLPRFVMRRIGF